MRKGIHIRLIMETMESKGPRARKWVCNNKWIRHWVTAHTREHMKDDIWENVRGSEQARESAVLHTTRVTGIGQKNEKERLRAGKSARKTGENKWG